jgi:ribonuclease VapC
VIAVDTSALMAILLEEPQASDCIAALEREDEVVISAGTLTEALIVASKRGLGDAMTYLVDRFGFTVVDVTLAEARQAAAAHETWGRGVHPAGLNFGDCFAYAVARQHNCPLLFVGADFVKTDIKSALAF